METAAIELERLTKWYGKHRGIIDVDLRVEPGEMFGFIGPNGAGKSTTIRLLLGLLRASGGAARIYGQTVSVFGKSVKEGIGYLPSEVRLYGDMTVRNLLRYSARFYPGRPLVDLTDLADRLEMDLGARIDRLSLGNRKKVGIAQAFLHKPRLLILDEPTSGLDPLIQSRFFELLQEWNAQGTTIFFSSHVLSDVQRLCHRVAILKEGRIVAVEEVDTVRSRSIKRVSVEWQSPGAVWVPEGAKDVAQTGARVSYLYQGQVPALIAELGARSNDVADVSVEQPSLEEVFMHYYGEEAR